jgi:hypothetical protein
MTDRWILAILEECKGLIGTRGPVKVIATDRLRCPALCGCRRPRLLVPKETLNQRDRRELRHIFLHELAHLRRHDILIGHAVSLLHVLHWFNPVIALGLRRMRADRELVCDGLVLSVLRPEEASAYGHTIVRQMERLLTSRWRLVLPGFCDDKARVKERIAMIAAFRRENYRWSPAALLLVGCLACVGLTDRLAGREVVEPPATAWEAYARGDFPTAHQDKHGTINRCYIRNMTTGKFLTADGEKVLCDANEPGEAGLWEFRFDAVTNTRADIMYYYSVSAGKYLMSDGQGNLTVSASEPVEAARWGNVPGVRGVSVYSHHHDGACLNVNEHGRVRTGYVPTDPKSFWEIHSVWRVKTSDDPRANPEWQRAHIPGPD